MKTLRSMTVIVIAMLILANAGCDENKRLAEQAERHAARQAEQNVRVAEMQRSVAEGAKQLVEADAKARTEIVELQKGVQAERAEIGRQRDLLEVDRREIAADRYLEPLMAAAITQVGLLIACVLPLIICWHLLRQPIEPADDGAVAELLLQDMFSESPLLLAAPPRVTVKHGREESTSEPFTAVTQSDTSSTKKGDSECHTS